MGGMNATVSRLRPCLEKYFAASHVDSTLRKVRKSGVIPAGQGGYGIMMAESLARSLAALMAGGELPEDIRALGVDIPAIDPGRFRVSSPESKMSAVSWCTE